MKRILSILSILLCLLIYVSSSSVEWMDAIQDFRDKHPTLKHRRYLHGDLYGFSQLRKYKQPQTYSLQTKSASGKATIRLFVFCDSYLDKRLDKSNFSKVDSIHFLRYWNSSTFLHYKNLDTNFQNYLVIEMAERHVRGLLNGGVESFFGMLVQDSVPNKPEIQITPEESLSSWEKFQKNCFNPNINSNLEINVFDYAHFEPIKELKAWINYKCFDRYNKIVYVDEEKSHLYYAPTLSDSLDEGAFKPLSQVELDTIVNRLNTIQRHFEGLGFERVYLSIIPNPVSCIHPELGAYNQLVERVSNHKKLGIPLLDVWKEFKREPKKYYHPGDSHWNSVGLQYWVDMLDQKMR